MITLTFFREQIPKAKKDCLFAILGSLSEKAARKHVGEINHWSHCTPKQYTKWSVN